MSPAKTTPHDLKTAIRAHDYATRQQVIVQSGNHQRTTLGLAVGAVGVLLGLLLDRETQADATRLFVLLGLTEIVIGLGAFLTIGSARTIDQAAEYVAEVEDALGVKGWESLLRAERRTAESQNRCMDWVRRWPAHFSRHLAAVYLLLSSVPLYLRLELGKELTTAEAIILWTAVGAGLVACFWLLVRGRAAPVVSLSSGKEGPGR